jgi:hypothetical protein
LHYLSNRPLGRKIGDWYEVPSRFAEFYMTLLATRLSEQSGKALLTNISANERLANSVRLDANLSREANNEPQRIHRSNRTIRNSDTLAQGMLVDLILQRITIDPNVPIEKLIRFRTDHAAELGRFRTNIGELTNSLSSDLPLERLQQQVHDLYVNEVLPSMQEIKEDLSSQGIRSFTENYIKIALLELNSTSVLTVLTGLGIPQAILAALGISITASAILYNLDKRELLRKNPYSYVLAADKQFRRRI